MALRALNRDCLWYIVDPLPGEAKHRFMQRLSKSGYASYNVVLAAFKLQQIRPDLEEIKLILVKAVKHGSHGAIYFHIY